MRITRSFLALLALPAVVACTNARTGDLSTVSIPGKIITEEMIAGYAVSNAWEVLRKTGHFIASRDDGPTGNTSIRSKRGKTSINLSGSDIPRIIVDGAPLTDHRMLRSLPAASIAWIQLLDGMEGTTFEGTNSGAGVIIIVSKTGT
ncbi:MAG: TonB-dependent receptor plug domain-containing protein [Gemmatimonadaceae bacterium]|nr:TonB-dependent receptor plug domain-containing protein [Gemmatimonadaceae bacterium]